MPRLGRKRAGMPMERIRYMALIRYNDGVGSKRPRDGEAFVSIKDAESLFKDRYINGRTLFSQSLHPGIDEWGRIKNVWVNKGFPALTGVGVREAHYPYINDRTRMYLYAVHRDEGDTGVIDDLPTYRLSIGEFGGINREEIPVS